jgi:hypothetical protein
MNVETSHNARWMGAGERKEAGSIPDKIVTILPFEGVAGDFDDGKR